MPDPLPCYLASDPQVRHPSLPGYVGACEACGREIWIKSETRYAAELEKRRIVCRKCWEKTKERR